MEKLSVREKIAYAIGDGSANIAWRAVSTFLFIFYTDVFGLTPATVGLLFLVARFSDGVSDIAMGIIGDRTKSRWGKFRPWILWTAVPLGIILSLLFTSPDWSMEWKIVYAYATYILFTLIYTANNIPYGALMAVMTPDDKERTSIGSYRMAGAFAGGMIVQGALLFLVAYFGNINPSVVVYQHSEDSFEVCVTSEVDIPNANINTKDAVAKFKWLNVIPADNSVTASKSFSMEKGATYIFGVENDTILGTDSLRFVTETGDVVKPSIIMEHEYGFKYKVCVSPTESVENVVFSTTSENATIKWDYKTIANDSLTIGKSFSIAKGETYNFVVTDIPEIHVSDVVIINQQKGYSRAIYTLSIFLVLFMFVTFYFTRERVSPPKSQSTNLLNDLKDLVKNRPWLILLIVGLMFNIYNNIKQGITVIYFTHYIHNQILAATYMVALMIASIAGAMATASLSRRLGKKHLFIGALLFTGAVNALLAFCSPTDITAIFIIGVISEIAAAILPTLFFTMLGDTADYSEYKNGRRATGLVYSAGSFATKFGGGIAGAIIGCILTWFGYNGQDSVAIDGAAQGIIMLMSWIPAVIVAFGALIMCFYPINSKFQENITIELEKRRTLEE